MSLPLNIDLQQILLHLLNFVVLFGILYFLLYSPVKKFMDQRIDHYKEMDEKARKDSADAEQSKTEYNKKLADVDSEIERKKQEARKALNEQNEKSIAAAKKEAARIIDDANRKAESDRRKLIEGAEGEIAEIAADAAEKILLKSSVSESYDQFLEAVADAAGGAENE